MISIISALLLTFSSLMLGFVSAPAAARQAAPLELAANAPDRHIVVPGDTLWGIAERFLKQPYRWPEIWHLNRDQIKNPQLIYPGQVLVLDRKGPQPRLTIAPETEVKLEPRIHVEANKKPIPSIPQREIEPFLSKPLVTDPETLKHAARIIATQGGRVYVSAGDSVYVVGAEGNAKLWQIYRPGQALVDPDSHEILGYQAVYLGTARLTRKGDPATFEIVNSRQEIGRGDRLLPAPPVRIISYVPHAPAKAISGRIISVYGGIGEGGQGSIVALSRGKRDGVDIGDVLAIYRSGRTVIDRHDGKRTVYKLPDERYGLLFVFRVFNRVSYALVMNVTRPVDTGDRVANP